MVSGLQGLKERTLSCYINSDSIPRDQSAEQDGKRSSGEEVLYFFMVEGMIFKRSFMAKLKISL